MGPEQLKPYVDLLTWQVVAVLAGIVFLPAVYVVVFNMSEFDLFGVKGKLRQKDAAKVEADAAEEVEEELQSGASASEALQDAAASEAETPRDRYKAAMKVWSAVAYIVRDLAVKFDCQHTAATQTSKQIAFLREQGSITPAQAERATELLDIRNEWRRNASRPIDRDEFRSFARRSRRLGTELANKLKSMSSIQAVA